MGHPNRMLSRTDALRMKGSWDESATAQPSCTTVVGSAFISPSRAARSDVLPQPTLPRIVVSFPAGNTTLMPRNTRSLPPV